MAFSSYLRGAYTMETTGTLIEGLTKLHHIPVSSIPVRGYITDEDDERFWLRDHEGTWIVRKADVVATGEYQGVSDPRIRPTQGTMGRSSTTCWPKPSTTSLRST